MKHLLNGVAVVAALAIAAPAWAQNPSGGNPMGTPGPNPGGPGLTPYSGGAAPASPSAMPAAPAAMPPAASGRMPVGGKKLSTGGHIPSSASNSAMPPMHRHAMHHPMRGHMAHGPTSTSDTTAQLNRAELARLQGAGAPPPSMGAPPPPPMQGGNSMGMPGPNTGGPGLTPYSTGTPQR